MWKRQIALLAELSADGAVWAVHQALQKWIFPYCGRPVQRYDMWQNRLKKADVGIFFSLRESPRRSSNGRSKGAPVSMLTVMATHSLHHDSILATAGGCILLDRCIYMNKPLRRKNRANDVVPKERSTFVCLCVVTARFEQRLGAQFALAPPSQGRFGTCKIR